MKSTFIAGSLAIFAACVAGIPTREQVARQFNAIITFTGGPASYTLQIPADNTVVPIDNNLAIDQISSEGGATCSFFGVDGSYIVIPGAGTATVGPPQAQVSASCLAL